MHIQFYDVRGVRAEAQSKNETHWVNIWVTEKAFLPKPGTDHMVTLFVPSAAEAKRIAHGINQPARTDVEQVDGAPV